MKKKFDEVMKLPGYYFRKDDGTLVYLDLSVSNKQDANDIPQPNDIFESAEKSIDVLIPKEEVPPPITDNSMANSIQSELRSRI